MFLQERAQEINDCLKGLAGKATVAVWGAAIHTAKLFEKTELLSYNIKAILDIDEKKWGDYFFGWKIEDPCKADWMRIDAVVISVPNREMDIIRMLRYELQYKGDIITFYTGEKVTPFYLLHDASATEVRYLGDYQNWKDAADECAGYDDSTIIRKVIDAVEKVKRGEAVWERDSCLFYEQKYNYQICAAILRCALENGKGRVVILDIGGSLGSAWFQNRNYFTELVDLEYVVAEQDHFVDYGHKNLEDGTLAFIKSTDIWEDIERFDIILMSASLQYIPQYEEILARIRKAQPDYVMLDRLLVSDRKRFCMETVPETLYASSYPVVIFDKNEVEKFFEGDYKLIENDISSVPEGVYFPDGKAESRLYVFERIEK